MQSSFATQYSPNMNLAQKYLPPRLRQMRSLPMYLTRTTQFTRSQTDELLYIQHFLTEFVNIVPTCPKLNRLVRIKLLRRPKKQVLGDYESVTILSFGSGFCAGLGRRVASAIARFSTRRVSIDWDFSSSATLVSSFSICAFSGLSSQ